VFLYAFDLLELDGRDLRREPWSERRVKLARLLPGAGHGVQFLSTGPLAITSVSSARC